MKLVSFSGADGKIRPGVLIEDDLVVDLSGEYADALAVITAGVQAVPHRGRAYKLDAVQLRAPGPNPPRVFAIGLNYRDHAKESGMEIPKVPVVFFKLTT